MQPFPHAGGPFDKIHRRFADTEAVPFEDLDKHAYAPEDVARARRSFVLRALDEQRSMVAFSELLHELCLAGAAVDVISAMTKIVRDEARHVDWCGRVVERLGGWPDDAPEPGWVRSHPDERRSLRIAKSIVGSLCIGETISVAMIAAVREGATDPVIHRLMTELLADESYHSRFGWWWLERFGPGLGIEDRTALRAWIPRLLASVEKQARPTEAQLHAAKPRGPAFYGRIDAMGRARAFDRAMHRTIIPGLERAGLMGDA